MGILLGYSSSQPGVLVCIGLWLGAIHCYGVFGGFDIFDKVGYGTGGIDVVLRGLFFFSGTWLCATRRTGGWAAFSYSGVGSWRRYDGYLELRHAFCWCRR